MPTSRFKKFKTWLTNDLILSTKLFYLRSLLGIQQPFNIWDKQDLLDDKQLNQNFIKSFESILNNFKLAAEGMGAEAYFVYLPAFRGFERSIEHPLKSQVLQAARKHNLKIFNFEEIFQKSGDPLQYYPGRKDGHYTPQANILIAETILN